MLVAVGAAVIAAAVGVAWHGKKNDQAAINATKPAAIAASAAAPATSRQPAAPPPASTDSKPSIAAAAAPAGVPAPSAAPAPAASSAPVSPAAAAVMVPSFDVARIGADGRAVIAGRAAPNARVVLLDGGKEIARGEADARGEWVILLQDPPLASGQHELRAVHHIEGRAPVTSEQVVVAVVPAPAARAKDGAASGSSASPDARRDETMVLLVPPSGAATLMQSPSRTGVPKSADLQVSTMDYDQHGQTTITGQATPGATVRAYLDDKVVAEGKAGPDGRWKIAPAEPVSQGQHMLRLDRLAADGKPSSRLELPFARLAVAAVPGDNTRRLHVVRGDNLWNIARAHYGEGWRHTMIFEANKDQIRNPNLIYPGQVFSIPAKAN
jgi:nucleoid-associated protein YgaU